MYPSQPLSKHILYFWASFTWFTLIGCDQYLKEPAREKIVEGYLQADAALPTLSVRETFLLSEGNYSDSYKPKSAYVKVFLLDSSAKKEAEYAYEPVPDSLYLYRPTNTNVKVLPNRTYRLEVLFEDGAFLSAHTTVPDTMKLLRTNGYRFVYNQTPSYEATISPCNSNNGPCHFIFSAESLTPSPERVVPFWQPQNNPFKLTETPTRYSSPLFNESNYTTSKVGNITINMLWISVIHYGKIRANLQAIDQNLYDLYRTQSQQQQLLGRLSPGEIPEALMHVSGGVGIFGSYSQVSNVIEIVDEQANTSNNF